MLDPRRTLRPIHALPRATAHPGADPPRSDLGHRPQPAWRHPFRFRRCQRTPFDPGLSPDPWSSVRRSRSPCCLRWGRGQRSDGDAARHGAGRPMNRFLKAIAAQAASVQPAAMPRYTPPSPNGSASAPICPDTRMPTPPKSSHTQGFRAPRTRRVAGRCGEDASVLRIVEPEARDRDLRGEDHLPYGRTVDRPDHRRQQSHRGQREERQDLQPHAEHGCAAARGTRPQSTHREAASHGPGPRTPRRDGSPPHRSTRSRTPRARQS